MNFMNKETDTKLYEDIIHITDDAPYSIHYTKLPADCQDALYLHWHKEMEFLVLEQGSLRFRVEDKEYLLQAGEGIFIPPGLLHYAENDDGTAFSFYALVLSPSFLVGDMETHAYQQYLLPILHNNLHFTLPLRKNEHWKFSILEHLTAIFTSHAPSELFVRGHCLLLWNLLYTNHIAKKTDLPLISPLAVHLMPALQYIQTHYMETITLGILAEYVHLSEGQFCRTFKLFTGMPPIQYLNRYRILQSCHELYHSDKSITEIAFNHGFNNISYYNRAFFKIMRMTPSAYRKRKNCQFENHEL